MNVSCVYRGPASYDNADVSCLPTSASSHLLAEGGSYHESVQLGFASVIADSD